MAKQLFAWISTEWVVDCSLKLLSKVYKIKQNKASATSGTPELKAEFKFEFEDLLQRIPSTILAQEISLVAPRDSGD